MISLEQVRVLEDRVEKAVAYIASLRGERAELGRRLEEAQSLIDEAAEEASAAEKRAEEASAKLGSFESRLADMAGRLAAAETRAAELATRAEEYKKDQAKIEEGIVHALAKLDSFEDLVLSTAVAPEKALEASLEAAPAIAEAEEGEAEEAEPAGIAVKSAPEPETRQAPEPAPAAPATLENELDIF
jgi:chromosome segregation ATPase